MNNYRAAESFQEEFTLHYTAWLLLPFQLLSALVNSIHFPLQARKCDRVQQCRGVPGERLLGRLFPRVSFAFVTLDGEVE